MGYNETTKTFYFYNTHQCLYDMILFGMRQRYLVYKLDLFLRKKYCKIEYVNNTDLYLSRFENDNYFTARENGCYYKFTKNDVRNIFMTGLTNATDEIPCPQSPTNPYTRKKFNTCELMDMYTFMGVSRPKMIELFKLSHFNIDRFTGE